MDKQAGTGDTVMDEDARQRSVRGDRGRVVYEATKAIVRSGEFDGATISVVDVAKRLNVSRTPVREALLQLKAEGWLEKGGDGVGFAVVSLSETQLQDYYTIREALEGAAAQLASRHATKSELLALGQLANAFQQAVEDGAEPPELEEMNRKFHRLVHRSSHSQLLSRILEPLYVATSRYPQSIFAHPDHPRRSARQHLELVEALAERDGPRSEAIAREHVRAGGEARAALIAQGLI